MIQSRDHKNHATAPDAEDLVLQLRIAELAVAEACFRNGSGGRHVLEIGAGSGHQAAALSGLGYRVDAIDLASSPYFHAQIHPVLAYDGRHIPFPDQTFDIVFSSNVLEHVTELEPLLAEMRRVLKPGGLSVHLMPSSSWRSWSLLTHFGWAAKRLFQVATLKDDAGTAELGRVKRPTTLRSALASLLPQRHGEHGTAVGEILSFRRSCWIREITAASFDFVDCKPAGVFYTNSLLLGRTLPLKARQTLAAVAGSACHVYVFRR